MCKNKRVIAVVIAVCMLICFQNISVMAEDYGAKNSNGDIEMYNLAITRNRYDFSIDANGNASCYSFVSVKSGYTARLTMQLQQRTGMWKTVQSWTNTDAGFVMFDETYQVEKGYDYRLMVVYIAYDSDGNQVESFYDLSDVKEYK